VRDVEVGADSKPKANRDANKSVLICVKIDMVGISETQGSGRVNDMVHGDSASETRESSVTRAAKVRPVLTEAERRSRLLLAFPWAKYLSASDLELFVREMAEHPSDIPNNQLEALLVRWKAHALSTTRRRAA
jgi:hypothetical protein